MSVSIQNQAVAVSRPKAKTHVPGEPGIWVFVLGDMAAFALFFGVFLFYRIQEPEIFSQSQAGMSQAFGAFNTFLMLSSSWFVAMAVQAARQNLGRATPLLLAAALACGVGFCFIKYLEYGAKISDGILLSTNMFYTLYYMLTGIHLFHVLIGMGVLALLIRSTWNGTGSAAHVRNVEIGVTFWHLVDLLWIVLFALFYLVK